MTVEDLRKKWDDKTLGNAIGNIIEIGIRRILKEAKEKPDEDTKGAMRRALEAITKDISDMPWEQIRYIIKRYF